MNQNQCRNKKAISYLKVEYYCVLDSGHKGSCEFLIYELSKNSGDRNTDRGRLVFSDLLGKVINSK